MRKCCKDGCERTATHVPLVTVPASGWPLAFHTPGEMIFNLPSCRDHVSTLTLDDIFTDHNRQITLHASKQSKRVLPDFDRAIIGTLSMADAKYQEFVRRISSGRPGKPTQTIH